MKCSGPMPPPPIDCWPSAPFGVNHIVHKTNNRLDHDLEATTRWKVPVIITSLGAREELNAEVKGYGGVTLADVIDEDEKRGLDRNEGAYFGLWNLVTKLNLALAAGIALPALALLGYRSKVTTSPARSRMNCHATRPERPPRI